MYTCDPAAIWSQHGQKKEEEIKPIIQRFEIFPEKQQHRWINVSPP